MEQVLEAAPNRCVLNSQFMSEKNSLEMGDASRGKMNILLGTCSTCRTATPLQRIVGRPTDEYLAQCGHGELACSRPGFRSFNGVLL